MLNPEYIKENFRKNLVLTRKLMKYTQLDLARRCGLHVAAISHYEAGRRTPSIVNLVRLSIALDVTTDHLVGGHYG